MSGKAYSYWKLAFPPIKIPVDAFILIAGYVIWLPQEVACAILTGYKSYVISFLLILLVSIIDQPSFWSPFSSILIFASNLNFVICCPLKPLTTIRTTFEPDRIEMLPDIPIQFIRSFVDSIIIVMNGIILHKHETNGPFIEMEVVAGVALLVSVARMCTTKRLLFAKFAWDLLELTAWAVIFGFLIIVSFPHLVNCL